MTIRFGSRSLGPAPKTAGATLVAMAITPMAIANVHAASHLPRRPGSGALDGKTKRTGAIRDRCVRFIDPVLCGP